MLWINQCFENLLILTVEKMISVPILTFLNLHFIMMSYLVLPALVLPLVRQRFPQLHALRLQLILTRFSRILLPISTQFRQYSLIGSSTTNVLQKLLLQIRRKRPQILETIVLSFYLRLSFVLILRLQIH